MKPPFLDIIPHRFRRRSLGVTLSVFTRALLNFAGLAVLIPVLVIILDTEGIRSNRWLAALYDFGGFTSDRTFILTVCACVVAVILFKSLANLALYKIERNFIYDLYRELSRRLYVDYRNRGLGFIKSSNSAVLARNVNVVCLTFVTGVLMPVAAMASEAVLFALLFGSLAIYNPLVALLTLAIFVPSVALYYYLVRQRLNRYGEEENRAQRRKSRTVIETFRGYADLEIAGAYPAMLSDFDRSMDEIIRVRQRNATIAALPPMFTEVGLTVGMAVLVAFCAGTDNTQMKLLFGIFAVGALRIMPSVRSIMGAWTSLRYNRYTIDVLRDARLYDTPAGIDTTQERMPFEREIRIEGLSFHFDDAPDRDILHDLSLTIRKGERIGIRGASGVGKTTLFNILLGFYRPTQGEVLLDGRPKRISASGRTRSDTFRRVSSLPTAPSCRTWRWAAPPTGSTAGVRRRHWKRPNSKSSSTRCRREWRPRSANAAAGSRAGNASGSASPAHSTSRPISSFSTKRPRRSTTAPRSGSTALSRSCRRPTAS